MNTSFMYLINCGLSWFIVIAAVIGYFLTLRRKREKWPFWIILAIGWALLAVTNMLVVIGVSVSQVELNALWLSSYLLVMASLLLIFLKLTRMMKARR